MSLASPAQTEPRHPTYHRKIRWPPTHGPAGRHRNNVCLPNAVTFSNIERECSRDSECHRTLLNGFAAPGDLGFWGDPVMVGRPSGERRGLRLRSVWGAAAAVAEYAPRCYRACFLNIFSRSKCNCWATYLLGKRVRNCQLIVLPVRRRAGQAIFDCSRECSGTPLVGPARAHGPETNGRKHSRQQTLRLQIQREREREKKKE